MGESATPIVKVIMSTDKNLKIIAELLATETSRNIIMLLVKNELYINQIAIKLQLRVSLVTHHIAKLKKLGLLEITNKPINKRTKDHQFYRIKTDVFISLTEEKYSKIIDKIFKNNVKFAARVEELENAFQAI